MFLNDPFWPTFLTVYTLIACIDFSVIAATVRARGGKMDLLGCLIVLFLAICWPLTIPLAFLKAGR